MSTTGPFKCKRMRITVTDGAGSSVLGVVEGYDIELLREGGVTPHYDSETGKHAVGTRHATLRLRRWFKTDVGKTDLLYALFQNETHFNLEGRITNLNGSKLTLSDCLIYNYSPRSGGANDIIVEEARGEALDWFGDIT